MPSPIPLPQFPGAPAVYDQRYFSDLVRVFSLYQQQVSNPGEGRNTFLVLTALQSDDVGLAVGSVFRDGSGVLKISMANRPNPRGLAATGSTGTVTVTV